MLLLLVLALAAAHSRRECGWIAPLTQRLGAIAERCRAGAADWREETPSGPPEPRLEALLAAAWREGLPLAEAIEAFRIGLDEAAELQRSSAALCRLLWWRAVVAVSVAAAARGLWLGSLRDALWAATMQDAAAQALGAVLLGGGQALVQRLAPAPWMGRRTVSTTASAWLAAYLRIPPDRREGLASEFPADLPITTQLAALDARELAVGSSLAAERRRLLTAFRRAAESGDRRRLLRGEELLPLLELVGVGGPVALLLLPLLVRMVHAA